jgi:hypothetical protein
MRCILGIAIVSSACFVKPERPFLEDSGTSDSVGADLAIVDPTCPSDDMSPSAMFCGVWGTPETSAGTLVRTGVLEARVTNFSGRAYCVTTNAFDFAHGASIEVVGVAQVGVGDRTQFSVTLPGGHTISIDIELTAGGTRLVGSCTAPGGFSSPATYGAQHRYLKIAKTSGDMIGAFVSDQAVAWTTLGSCSLAGVDLTWALARFGVVGGSSSVARSSSFDNFRTCTTPP